MIETTNLTSVDLSIFIVLFGALFLYFGKIIGDTKVEKYDKLGYYIEGMIFSIVYVFITSLFAYYFKDTFGIPASILLVIQVISLVFLFLNVVAHEYFRKYGLLDEFKKIAEKRLIEIKEQDSIIGRLAKSKHGEDSFRSRYGLSYAETYYKISLFFGKKSVLGIFSFLSILSNLKLYESGDLFTFWISLLLTFFILSMVALAYGFGNAYYPPAKIYLDNGETMEGRVLKFDEYVYLIKDDKKFFINKDKITYVEESLLKEKSD